MPLRLASYAYKFLPLETPVLCHTWTAYYIYNTNNIHTLGMGNELRSILG